MAASIRHQTIFFQPQHPEVSKKPPCHQLDYTPVDFAFGYHNLEPTATALHDPPLPPDDFDWHVPLDDPPYDWDFSTVPDDSAQPFFASTSNIESAFPANFPALSVNGLENSHTVDYSPDPAPTSGSPGSRSRSSPGDKKSNPGSSTESNSRVEKRKANTVAARRYRQKRLDKVAELEAELRKTRLERDAFKEQSLKLQGETEILRDLLRQNNKP